MSKASDIDRNASGDAWACTRHLAAQQDQPAEQPQENFYFPSLKYLDHSHRHSLWGSQRLELWGSKPPAPVSCRPANECKYYAYTGADSEQILLNAISANILKSRGICKNAAVGRIAEMLACLSENLRTKPLGSQDLHNTHVTAHIYCIKIAQILASTCISPVSAASSKKSSKKGSLARKKVHARHCGRPVRISSFRGVSIVHGNFSTILSCNQCRWQEEQFCDVALRNLGQQVCRIYIV
eukprot:6195661-Pleurochrysis_carterae.AAC.2